MGKNQDSKCTENQDQCWTRKSMFHLNPFAQIVIASPSLLVILSEALPAGRQGRISFFRSG